MYNERKPQRRRVFHLFYFGSGGLKSTNSLTLAPIWFPHWPACKCTISRMMIDFYYFSLFLLKKKLLSSSWSFKTTKFIQNFPQKIKTLKNKNFSFTFHCNWIIHKIRSGELKEEKRRLRLIDWTTAEELNFKAWIKNMISIFSLFSLSSCLHFPLFFLRSYGFKCVDDRAALKAWYSSTFSVRLQQNAIEVLENAVAFYNFFVDKVKRSLLSSSLTQSTANSSQPHYVPGHRELSCRCKWEHCWKNWLFIFFFSA